MYRDWRTNPQPWCIGVPPTHLATWPGPVTPVLKNVFSFQSGSHDICFLIALANGSLRHKVAVDPGRGLLGPALTFRKSEAEDGQGNSPGWQLPRHLKMSIYHTFKHNTYTDMCVAVVMSEKHTAFP